MVFVGIDIANTLIMLALQTMHRKSICSVPFENDQKGFAKLLSSFASYAKTDVIIGLEATSVYGENLISYLANLGYEIALINPIETSSVRKKNIRNAKTDKIDAKVICKYLATEEYRFLQSKELQTLQLRGLCRFRQALKKSNSRLKTQLVSYLDVSFPEYPSAFSTVHGKGAYAVLSEFPSASAVSKANITKLTNLLCKSSHGKFNRSKAEELKALAKRSVCRTDCDMGFQIKQTITQIQLISAQMNELLKKQIVTVFESLNSVIATIPGIGAINGSMILSEIGDIRRFSNPNQLIAFAGLDPIIRQSGNFRAKTTRMSKRGSGVLRYALINAAWNVSLNNVTFKEYYSEKFSQKGRHYAALGHVAGKLTRVIFAMLKNEMVFNLP